MPIIRKENKKLVVAVSPDYAPFEFKTLVDGKDQVVGSDIKLAQAIADELGVKLEVTTMSFDNVLSSLQAGKADIAISGISVTDERKKQVDFALPYMKVSIGVVSPKDKVIKDVKELEGKTLIVTKGTTAETYFEKNYPNIKLQKYDQYSDAYQALLDGRGDAFSTDNTEVLAWALENKGYEVGITSLGDPDTIAPAVQKGNKELLDFINKDIKKLGEENFFHKDYEKTLHPTYGDAAKADDLVVEGGEVK